MSAIKLKGLPQLLLAAGILAGATPGWAAEFAPLPETKYDAARAELGRHLFFDTRLSGDAAISCASCHDPDKGWADGLPLSKAYPASEHFRNAPGLVNARFKTYYNRDGQLDGADLGTMVRNEITEAHIMNMDSRLMQERLMQVPEYVQMWTAIFGNGDINGMTVFGVVGEFVKTLVSRNVPFDNYLKGDKKALSAEASRGFELFQGKAGCAACHSGQMLSDGGFHRTGVPENPEVTAEPLRHITMARHYSTHGMPNYMNTYTDVGRYAITKDRKDIGKFATPSLRELKYTAPYMHNGMFATLESVIDFYDRGAGKGSELKPLKLSAAEKKDLKAFLLSLSGDPVVVDKPVAPAYQLRTFGKN